MRCETIPYVDKPVSRILFGAAQLSFLRGEENNAHGRVCGGAVNETKPT